MDLKLVRASVVNNLHTREAGMENDFIRRMENWRRVVRDGGSSKSFCASWARLYVSNRVRDEIEPRYSGTLISPDVLDGWLIEAAVRTLISFDEKMALRYWYVLQYPEHWIKAKLMLRKTGVRVVLARAENNLMKVLDKLDGADIILTNRLQNNSHAGVDPRPDTSLMEVPVSAKKSKALID